MSRNMVALPEDFSHDYKDLRPLTGPLTIPICDEVDIRDNTAYGEINMEIVCLRMTV
jgi:hypothetical protein